MTRNPSREDVAAYRSEIDSAKLNTARARNPERWIERVERLVTEANEFCARFKFKTRFAGINEGELAELKAKAAKESARKAEATKRKAAKIERENAEAIAEWLLGNRLSLPYSVSKIYLRRAFRAEDHAPILQTSRGAVVPLADAERAFRFIMLKRETGWHRNGETFRVGDFQLDAVNAQGIVAGCHRIDWKEIERFASTQNW